MILGATFLDLHFLMCCIRVFPLFYLIMLQKLTKTKEKKLNYNKHLQIMLFETPPFIEQQIVRRNGTRFWPALYRVPKRVPQSRNP